MEEIRTNAVKKTGALLGIANVKNLQREVCEENNLVKINLLNTSFIPASWFTRQNSAKLKKLLGV